MCVYGSPGIGKSALLQLAALRALFKAIQCSFTSAAPTN
jgi:DNA replication protein DnaC